MVLESLHLDTGWRSYELTKISLQKPLCWKICCRNRIDVVKCSSFVILYICPRSSRRLQSLSSFGLVNLLEPSRGHYLKLLTCLGLEQHMTTLDKTQQRLHKTLTRTSYHSINLHGPNTCFYIIYFTFNTSIRRSFPCGHLALQLVQLLE